VISRAAGVRWGLHANRWGRGEEGPFELDRMRDTGVSWIREEFDAAPDAETDTLYLNAARRGLRILPLLQKGNLLPADVDEYANIVAAFARRFGPGGEFWAAHPELDASLASTHIEIYNEPYGDWYGPVEPGRFAAMLRTVVPRARRANPRAQFLIPVDRTPDGQRHTWIDDLYRAEPRLNELFDGVAMHPYSGNRSPDQPDDPWGFARIAEARAALQAHGAGAKEFWITEIGWSTCPGDPESCVSEAQQAAHMERLAQLVRTRYTFVDAVFLYHFIGFERDPTDSEDFYGLLHADFSPKPGFHALRRITGAG
jgi:polysaccharide biosynthesis protein PslG